MEEVYKNIDGYDGFYQVSNLGNVKSLKGKTERLLKQYKDKNGYLHVSLSKNSNLQTFQVHRLVCLHFIENNEDLVVNHKDGNKSNNILENLELVTQKENIKHSFVELGRNGTMLGRTGKNHGASKQVAQIKNDIILNTFENTVIAAQETNSNQSCISRVCNGERKTHNGFNWKYI